jgi:arylsulfatase A-like enzyme
MLASPSQSRVIGRLELASPSDRLRGAARTLGLLVSFLYFRAWALIVLRGHAFFWPKWCLGLAYDLLTAGTVLLLLAMLGRRSSEGAVKIVSCALITVNWANFEFLRHLGQPFLPQTLAVLSPADSFSGYGLEVLSRVLDPIHAICAWIVPLLLTLSSKRLGAPSSKRATVVAVLPLLLGTGTAGALSARFAFVTEFPRTLTWNFYVHGPRHWLAHAVSPEDVVSDDYALDELSDDEHARLQDIARKHYDLPGKLEFPAQPLFRTSGAPRASTSQDAAFAPASTFEHRAAGRRNVVMIHLESFRAASVDGLGGPWTGVTPRLSRRMKDGAYFTRAFTNNLPSDRSVTSLYCSLPVPDKAISAMYRPRPKVRCLTDILAEMGYRNARMSGIPSSFQKLGEFFAEHGVEETYGSRELDQAYPHPHLERIPENGYDASKLYDERVLYAARSWIRTHVHSGSDAPFFLILETMTNHVPWELPADTLRSLDEYRRLSIGPTESGTEETARLHQTMRLTDDYVSDFLEWLDQFDGGSLRGNTLVVVYSDHPPWFPEPGFERYEEVIKESWIPLFILGLDAEDGPYTHPVSLFDVAPTMLRLLGVTSSHSFVGTDLFDAQAPHWMSFSKPGNGRIFFAAGEQFHFSGGRRSRLQNDMTLVDVGPGRDIDEESFAMLERFLLRKLAVERGLVPFEFSARGGTD